MSEQDHAAVLERMYVHESLPTTEQSACKAGAEALRKLDVVTKNLNAYPGVLSYLLEDKS